MTRFRTEMRCPSCGRALAAHLDRTAQPAPSLPAGATCLWCQTFEHAWKHLDEHAVRPPASLIETLQRRGPAQQ